MIKDIINGFQAYGKAIDLIFRLRLWRYFFLPAIISVILAVIILSSSWAYSDNLAIWLVNYLPFESAKAYLEPIVGWISWLIMTALGILLFKHLVMILSSPFMSMLSEKIEKHLKGDQFHAPPFSLSHVFNSIIRGVRISIRLIVRELFYVLILMLLGLIPGLGVITIPLIFLVQAFYAGFGNMDFTMERYFNVSQSIRFVRSNKGIAIGSGIPFLLILLTILGFLVVLPLSTIASTVETVKRIESAEKR